MNQTPVHEQHNPDLLAFIPTDAKKLVEVGCSSGALAREYKKINNDAHYTGIEISAQYAELAKRYCDVVMLVDIEQDSSNVLLQTADCDCWIFGDSLEHLRDPWALMRNIRKTISKDGSVVACIPNVQHWSVQRRLNCGDFRYEEMGLLDKTHLRWFTRITIFELFSSTGFKVVEGMPRIFDEPHRDRFLPAIKLMAELSGVNPEIAVADCLPLQYVIRAVPV
jgi:SAM-dependent methyltransferase